MWGLPSAASTDPMKIPAELVMKFGFEDVAQPAAEQNEELLFNFTQLFNHLQADIWMGRSPDSSKAAWIT